MFALSIKNDLLFHVISIDVNSLVLVGFGVQHRHSILEGKTQLQVMSEINHFRHSIHQDVAFGVHI